jgi:DNA-binding NtrC family response regulator
MIARDIVAKLALEMQLPSIPVFEAADMATLKRYHWPGNVRELRNVLERSIMLSGQGPFRVWLSFADKPSKDWAFQVRFPEEQSLREINERVTEELCLEALRRTGGNQKEAARLLGISRDSMHRYARKFGFKRANLTRFKS